MVLFQMGPVTIIQTLILCLKLYQYVKKLLIKETMEGKKTDEPRTPALGQGCGCCRRCNIYAQQGMVPIKPFIECDKHLSYLCAFACSDCKIPICLKCKQQDHNKHTTCELFELEEAATPSVNSTARKPYLMKKQLPLKTSGVESEVYNGYDLVRNQVKNQAEALHSMIDELLRAALNSADEMEFRDLEILEKFRKEFRKVANDSSNETSTAYHIIYDRKDNQEVKVSDEESSFSETLHYRAPKFLEGLPSIKDMRAQFGTIKSGVVDRRSRPQQLLPKPILQFAIDSLSKYTLYVRYFHSNMILQSGTGPEVHVMNENGKCLETIKITSGIDMPTGLAIAEDGTILYTDFSHKRVRRIKADRTIEIFIRTEGKPNGICCTRSGDVIVCLQDCPQAEGKVSWFNNAGDKLHDFTDTYLKGPTSVYENINCDVCISEESMRKVIVVDKDFIVRFMYDGNVSSGDVTKFTPRDICCDSVGHILIADFSNRLIHMLDEDGRFIRYLLTKEDDLSYPHGICVDAGNRLWIAERYSKKIKVYQYLES
ncbi:uncharacterized protein LOC144620862 [Crassostrea virginica]